MATVQRKRRNVAPQDSPRKRVTRPEDILENGIVSVRSAGGNGNILNYVVIDDLEQDIKIIGSIVNIAAYFHVGLVGIDIEAIAALNGLASYNKKLFGAGTLRIYLNFPPNFYTGNYEKDMQLLMEYNRISSMKELNELLEKKENGEPVEIPRIKYPAQNLTGLLFDSGRIVLIGASNEHVARYGASLLVYMLQKERKIPARFSDFRIVNMVVTFSLGFDVDLDRLDYGEGSTVTFKPQVFPAVMMPSPDDGTFQEREKVTLLVNYTGNCILTGSRDRHSVKEFFKQKYRIIIKYRKKTRDEEEREVERNKDKVMEYGAPGRALVAPTPQMLSTPLSKAIAYDDDDEDTASASTAVARQGSCSTGGSEPDIFALMTHADKNRAAELRLCEEVIGIKHQVLEYMTRRGKQSNTNTADADGFTEKPVNKVNSKMNACAQIHNIIESLESVQLHESLQQPELYRIGGGVMEKVSTNHTINASQEWTKEGLPTPPTPSGEKLDFDRYAMNIPTLLNRSMQRMTS